MTRTLKALVLAALASLAALAMSALLASGTQAEAGKEKGTLHAGATPSTLTNATVRGTQYGLAAENFFKAFGEEVTCENTGVNFTGTLKNGSGTSVTIEPHYKDCRGPENRPATVTMNGCDYIFTQPTTAADVGAGNYTSRVDLTCPHENKIKIEVFAHGTPTAHTGGIVCEIFVYPKAVATETPGETKHKVQELGGHLKLVKGTDPVKDDLTIKATVTGITASREGVCQFFKTTHTETAEYQSTVTATAFEDAGTHTNQYDLWIKELPL
jgi:hypothetical protein